MVHGGMAVSSLPSQDKYDLEANINHANGDAKSHCAAHKMRGNNKIQSPWADQGLCDLGPYQSPYVAECPCVGVGSKFPLVGLRLGS